MYYAYSKKKITFTCAVVVRLQNEGTIHETLPGPFISGSQRDRTENVLTGIFLHTENINAFLSEKFCHSISRTI